MTWNVEYTDEFGEWWTLLNQITQEDIDTYVHLLEQKGPQLGFPFCSSILGSRHSHMRELRVQSQGRPVRIFYAFDPMRTAILLIGGDKTGDNRFYETTLAQADQLYDVHMAELENEKGQNP